MDKINKEMVIIFFVIILAIWVVYPFMEGFNASTNEFVPVGDVRYGLRGDKLRRVPISKYFIGPNRNIRLSQSNGMMWEADASPEEQGIPDCHKTQCPTNTNEFDSMDTCWKCGSGQQPKMAIPDIHSH